MLVLYTRYRSSSNWETFLTKRYRGYPNYQGWFNAACCDLVEAGDVEYSCGKPMVIEQMMTFNSLVGQEVNWTSVVGTGGPHGA